VFNLFVILAKFLSIREFMLFQLPDYETLEDRLKMFEGQYNEQARGGESVLSRH
jgi:hypothetical protein